MRCHKCRKELRPRKTKKADHPGTIEHYGQGYCITCWRVVLPERERIHRPDDCVTCRKPMRPKDSSSSDFPGTVMHKGNGKCRNCVARKSQHVHAGKSTDEIEDPGVRRLIAAREERVELKRRQERARRIRQEQEAVQRRFIQSRRAA